MEATVVGTRSSLPTRDHRALAQRRPPERVGYFTTIYTLGVLLAGVANAQPTVGYVLEEKGNWTLAGKTAPLSLGNPLPAGGRLQNTHPAEDDQIVIADLSWTVMKTVQCRKGICKECRQSGACYDPVHPLPQAPLSEGAFSTILQGATELLFGKPERYSVHRVRSLRDSLSESVLLVAADKVDINPVFAKKKRGVYYIRFDPLVDTLGQRRSSEIMQFDWNPTEPPSAVPAKRLAPGLYVLRLLEKGDNTYRTSPFDAWVLLSDASNHSQLAATFQRATNKTAEWTQIIPTATARGYLRALLEYEARQLQENGQAGAKE